jgi:ubiquinone biosynthesis protein
VSSALKAGHAARYAVLARLLLKHQDAVVSGDGISGGSSDDTATAEDARELVDELVRLGPTFVKLGQLLSTRSDLLPPVYLDELSNLQERVKPLPAAEARRVIEEELGIPIAKAFGRFEGRPVGSASLGQVHRAQLGDGRQVAVKVQRAGVRRQCLDDMEVIAELAAFLEAHSVKASRLGLVDMVEAFRRSLMDELDYRREAANLRLLGENLSGHRRLFVPQPVDEYTTSRVLTMDYVEGGSVGSMAAERSEAERQLLGKALVDAYLDQVLVHGFCHADPHPGNIVVTTDGRLALIDLGMVARISPQVQEHLLRLLLAVSSRDGEAAAECLSGLGRHLGDFDRDRLVDRVTEVVLRYAGSSVGDLQVGRLLAELAVASSEAGLRPRSELTLLSKTLLNLDEVVRSLDPDIDLEASIEARTADVMRHRMVESASPSHLMRSALDTAAFAEALPGRLNKVLESLAEGKLTLNLEGLDEEAVLRGAQKLANRVAIGVLVAAFVVSAALFSQAKTSAIIWGYPVLTIVFLFMAAASAGWMALMILRRDLPQRDRPKRGG